jgi:RHS repeat-associated protein
VHSDHLDTPRLLTDSTATESWRASYRAYGAATVDADPDRDGQVLPYFNIRFPGQYFDAETNLHYNRFRYYDPETGRYINQDPIGRIGGLNLYAYGENNPGGAIDPFGLDTIVIITDDPNGMGIGGFGKKGTHAALFVDDGLDGEPKLYDPAGGYQGLLGVRPNGAVFGFDEFQLIDYIRFHLSEAGSDTVTFILFETSEDLEKRIAENMEKAGDAIGGQCSTYVGNVLKAAGSPFESISGTFTPEWLGDEVRSSGIAPTAEVRFRISEDGALIVEPVSGR